MDPYVLLKTIKKLYDENPTSYNLSFLPKYILNYIQNSDIDVIDISMTKRVLSAIYQDLRFDGENFNGKRLTTLGLEFVRLFFQGYEYPYPERRNVIVKHLIFLSKNCQYPYYIDKKTIVFFDKEMAFLYRLSGSDMITFCDAYEHLAL